MKLLMIYTDRFAYKTSVKAVEEVQDIDEEREINDTLIGFIQVEKEDEENLSAVETKMIKNLKWAARKNDTRKILLHSFAHLSESKATLEATKQLFDSAEHRLTKAEYEVSQTPFGYFLDLDIQAPGKSLARIFVDI
ncbi:MAG: threonyl-tRNA synthetase editing domain-containing protein [candidate division Zixibacteria bacterium]